MAKKKNGKVLPVVDSAKAREKAFLEEMKRTRVRGQNLWQCRAELQPHPWFQGCRRRLSSPVPTRSTLRRRSFSRIRKPST